MNIEDKEVMESICRDSFDCDSYPLKAITKAGIHGTRPAMPGPAPGARVGVTVMVGDAAVPV